MNTIQELTTRLDNAERNVAILEDVWSADEPWTVAALDTATAEMDDAYRALIEARKAC